MRLPNLAFAFIRRRPGAWVVQVLTLAFGICLITSLILLERGVEQRLQRDLAGIDLVVGAKGSPLQIILSSIFGMDTPTGNISLAQAEAISRNILVSRAVPISVGDSVRGERIVGTIPAYAALYGARLASGRWWWHPLEAVLGSAAARKLRLVPGAQFVSEHGLSGGELHAATPYRVVGVLAPTGSVIDRLVLTDTSSVWKVHEGEQDPAAALAPLIGRAPAGRQVTALLVQYRSAMGAVLLPQMVRAKPDLQAASPAVEVRRLARTLGIGADVVQWIAAALLLLAAAGFVVNLWSAIDQRRPELALLRVLGASPMRLMTLIAAESALLGLVGSVVGIAMGRLIISVLGALALREGAEFSVPAMGRTEVLVLLAGIILALLAALPAALSAGRVEPARELAR